MDDIRSVNRNWGVRQPGPTVVPRRSPPAAPPNDPLLAGSDAQRPPYLDYSADPPADSDTKTVEIKITVPSKLPLPSRASLKKAAQRSQAAASSAYRFAKSAPVPQWRPSRRQLTIGLGSLAAVSLVVFGLHWLTTPKQPDQTQASNTLANSHSPTISHGTPDYTTLLPGGKTISQLGGWSRISPSDRNAVYAYADKLDGVPITVSQQPLPKTMQPDTKEQMATLAESFNANEKITISGTTVYIGNSARGPQSIIFNKNNLLILIKSSSKIDINHWSSYISSLR